MTTTEVLNDLVFINMMREKGVSTFTDQYGFIRFGGVIGSRATYGEKCRLLNMTQAQIKAALRIQK